MTSALWSLANFLIALAASTGLAADERDRGRSDEQLVEPLDARFRRGPLDQRVLGDRVGRRTSQRPAQFGQVGDRQTAILGDHGRGRALELLGDVCNGGGLVSLGHACLLGVSVPVERQRTRPETNERPDAGCGRGAQPTTGLPRPPAWAAGNSRTFNRLLGDRRSSVDRRPQ